MGGVGDRAPVRTAGESPVLARFPAARDFVGLLSSWVFAVEEGPGSGAAGWMTEATSFDRSPRSISALARTPSSMAFLTGGRMVRSASDGLGTPGGALTPTGEGVFSTTVGMLVMDEGVGTARGAAVIERGVGGLGLAARE